MTDPQKLLNAPLRLCREIELLRRHERRRHEAVQKAVSGGLVEVVVLLEVKVEVTFAVSLEVGLAELEEFVKVSE